MVAADDPRWEAARRALHRVGAPGAAPEVVREGLSLLVRQGDVLVRVRPRSEEPVAAREVAVASLLGEVGVPVVELVEPGGQPWVEGAQVVTAWRWVDPVGPASPAHVGALARSLADRTADGPAFDVPRFEPLTAIRRAVEHLPVGDEQADVVRRLAHEHTAGWAAVADHDPAGVAVVHGDLHRDNVVVGAAGPILTDLELAGAGPPSYDAAPAVVAVSRYGADPATLDAFIEALGRDPRHWSGFGTCVAVYELWVTAWAVGVRHTSSALAAEAARRVRSLSRHDHERWELW